eukprot:COSAG02_NODE_29382_length_570_cov_1.095541_1_plen_96_part_01
MIVENRAGVEMSPVDFIRNYVHEHFESEAAQRRIYSVYWLPMERACASASSTHGLSAPDANINATSEGVFAAALAHLGMEGCESRGLWPAFQEWWQ